MKTMKTIANPRRAAGLVLLLIFAAGLAVGPVVGEEPTRETPPPAGSPPAPESAHQAPPVVEIDAVTSATTRYLPVRFPHEDHAEAFDLECKQCHETRPHGDLEAYYHRLCLGCHRADEAKTPPDCFQCHKERR